MIDFDEYGRSTHDTADNFLPCLLPIWKALQLPLQFPRKTFAGGFMIVHCDAIARVPLSAYWFLLYQ